MSVLDYGYIPIHNKRVRFLSKESTVFGTPYSVGNMGLYKCHAEKIYIMSMDKNRIIIDFEMELDYKNKMVVYWEYQTIQYKTKRIGDMLYLTTFKHRGRFKKIIHGYDVDLKYCHDKKRLKYILKIVRKMTE